MVVNSRAEILNFNNKNSQLENDLIAFKKLNDKYKSVVESILKMYSCERCGNCCRTENVSSGGSDFKNLMEFDKELFTAAVKKISMSTGNFFILKTPCMYLDSNNKCKCQRIKPVPCRYYPFIFLYGHFISISYCPYGQKIINDLLKYCKIRGIKVEDKENVKDSKMAIIIDRMESLYDEMGLEKIQEMKTLNVPFDELENFYNWIKVVNKTKNK